MQLSLSLRTQAGLNWGRLQQLAPEIEAMGFAGLYCSDHFVGMVPPNRDALDLIVALTWLATHTQRLHFGSLVAPLSFRDPVLLTRQAMAIDDLSGGRLILGVGTGWQEREHQMFGYPLGDVPTRMDRLTEGLEVITQLIRSPDPITFAGSFYQLQAAQLLPKPARPTRVLVGGNGPKRTLPLVARYADIWNSEMAAPALFQTRSAQLDDLLVANGRRPTDVKRTVTLPVLCWRTDAERDQRLAYFQRTFRRTTLLAVDNSPVDDNQVALAGTPEQILHHLQRYAAAGCAEVIILWSDLTDLEGIAILAEQILPSMENA